MCARKLGMLIFSVFGRPNSFQLEITTYGKFDPGFQNLPSDNFLGCTGYSYLLISELLELLAGLEIRGTLVANATMFSHLLPGFSCGSKHLLLP